MKISLSSLKKYVKIPDHISDEELIRLIGARLVEVESVVDLGAKYQHSFIVRVLSAEPIPDTHLSRCLIDAGQHPLMSEQPDGIQVICGAPNVHAGMFAVWLAPGAVVPSTFGGENFTLSARKLRGFDSFGMLAGADELDFGDDHSAIVEIAPDFCTPGTSFATAFNLTGPLLDIENKSLTHRPDTFGLIGFAREVAGILGIKFIEPDFYHLETAKSPQTSTPDIKLKITLPADPELCPRYCAAVLELPPAKNSPYLTPDQVFLYQSGMRPVSPLVDLTNILMLETGQPLHAFDYDKLLKISETIKRTDQVEQSGQTTKQSDPPGQGIINLGVRLARPGEALELLDGKTLNLTDNDIIVTAEDTPIALAGAIGSASTAVDSSTTRILLESAAFSLYNLRKTQMQHGIFTEAITRFTKGQPAGSTMLVLAAAIKRLGVPPLAVHDQINPAAAVSRTSSSTATTDANPSAIASSTTPTTNVFSADPISVSTHLVNQVLGTNYSAEEIVSTLDCVNIKTTASHTGNITIFPPFWRPDLKIPVDIIEEVGRLRGYETITPIPPLSPLIPVAKNPIFTLQSELRDLLSLRFDAHEILTYSFISRDLALKCGLSPDNHYAIANSISPALQLFRSYLTPSLLEKTYDNLRANYQDFNLYEFNQVTDRSLGLDQDQVPVLQNHLASVLFGDYYAAKAQITAILATFGLTAVFEPLPLKDPSAAASDAPAFFEPLHTAIITVNGKILGHVGAIRGSVLQKFKLIKYQIAAFEIDCNRLNDLIRTSAAPIAASAATTTSSVATTPAAATTSATGPTTIATVSTPSPASAGSVAASSSLPTPKFSRFPKVYRDLTVKTPTNCSYADLTRQISASLPPELIITFHPTSIYQPAADSTNISVFASTPDPATATNTSATQPAPSLQPIHYSFHFSFAHPAKTLTSAEISAIMDKIAQSLSKIGATVV